MTDMATNHVIVISSGFLTETRPKSHRQNCYQTE